MADQDYVGSFMAEPRLSSGLPILDSTKALLKGYTVYMFMSTVHRQIHLTVWFSHANPLCTLDL